MISIIMPAYNVQDYIYEAIHSVLKQTYANWELIVINDGSTDYTEKVIQQIVDPRIRVINQSNQGVSSARNKGMSEAQGEYLAFLDGDDLWESSFLEEMVKSIAGYNIVYCGCSTFAENHRYNACTYGYHAGKILYQWIKFYPAFIQIGAMLFRRSFLEQYNIRFTEGCHLSEDSEFIVKALAFSETNVIPRELLRYRKRPNSATHIGWHWGFIQHIETYERIKLFVINHYDGIDKDRILEALGNQIAYRYYRFLLGAIRQGYFEKALVLVKEISKYVDMYSRQWSFRHRLRWLMISSNNVFWWKMIYMLSRER